MNRRASRPLDLETSPAIFPYLPLAVHLGTDPNFITSVCGRLESGDLEKASQVILHFCDRHGFMMPVLKELIVENFEKNIVTPGSVLRNEDILSKMIAAQTLTGTSFLKESLGPVVNGIVFNPQESFEIDPSKVAMQMGVEQSPENEKAINKVVRQNKTRLESACNRVIAGLKSEDAISRLPRMIRALCHIIGSCAKKYTPESIAPLIGGFFILRFVNPSIINPEKRGIIQGGRVIPPTSRRNLILLSKVLQGLASGVAFGAKEPFMAEMQKYLDTCTKLMNDYLINLTKDPNARDPKSEWPELSGTLRPIPIDLLSESDHDMLVLFHKLCHERKAKILEAPPEKTEYANFYKALVSPLEDDSDFSETETENSEYTRLKENGLRCNFTELDNSDFLYIAGTDRNGFPSIVINGSAFPAATVNPEEAMMYIIYRLDPFVVRPYTVFFFQSGASSRNRPSFSWMKKLYTILGRKYKKNLKCMVLVHSTFWTKLSVNCFLPFVSAKFWAKVKYVNRIQDLDEYIDPTRIIIPEIAIKFDQGELEQAVVSSEPAMQGVFGIPISYTVGEQFNVPPFVQKCIAYLKDYGPETEGIFRIAPSATTLSQLQKDIDEGKQVEFDSTTDPHIVAALLKIYFRLLPEPLLTFDLFDEFINLTTMDSGEFQIQKAQLLISNLPPGHYATLEALLGLLLLITQNSAITKMTAANVGICFGPNLLKPRTDSPEYVLIGVGLSAQVIALLVTNQTKLFRLSELHLEEQQRKEEAQKP